MLTQHLKGHDETQDLVNDMQAAQVQWHSLPKALLLLLTTHELTTPFRVSAY